MENEEKHIHNLEEDIEGIEPDFKGRYPSDQRGKFVKHYEYGNYKEVIIDLYTKGIALTNTVINREEWYHIQNIDRAFTKAKLMKERYNSLNQMLGD
jgi:hypothetical protein